MRLSVILSLAMVAGAGAPAPALADNAAPPAAQARSVRRDPRGIKGISPFWEALRKGDRAYVAGNHDAALVAYGDAISALPNHPLGHYRVGEAYLAKNMLKEAEDAWVTALRLSASQPAVRAKVLFVLADLRERQRQLDQATEKWNAYEAHCKDPRALGYPASAAARKKAISEWKDLESKSTEVRRRIETRLKEAEDRARESASKASSRP